MNEGTTQIGLRLDNRLLKKIDELAEDEGIGRMNWIKRALGVFVKDEENGKLDGYVEDFVYLRIDEETFKEYSGRKKIPSDVQEARKQVLAGIVNQKRD